MKSLLSTLFVLLSLASSCSSHRLVSFSTHKRIPFYNELSGRWNPTFEEASSVANDVMGINNRLGGQVFNVIDFGAVGNGLIDDSQAFIRAWEASCGSLGAPTLVVPKGLTFFLMPLAFQGPCKSPILVQILGNLEGPSSVLKNSKESWIEFSNVNGLSIDGSGSGQLDAKGQAWWKQCNTQDCSRPVGLRLHGISSLQLKGLRHMNSAKGHIAINQCNGVGISNLTILAPQESPNTDGIDISSSTHVTIQDITVSTGDDCIAINGGTSFVNITNVLCGPGHGISVGSLGGNGKFDIVEEVRVQNCMFRGTQNGARIKTWQGGSGYARKISFSDIKLDNVENPIIIDQFYCGDGHNCQTKSMDSTVDVSDVTFSGVRGTSASQEAIVLNCDRGRGCNGIVLQNIDIFAAVPRQQVSAICDNVRGRTIQVSPVVPCLAPTFL